MHRRCPTLLALLALAALLAALAAPAGAVGVEVQPDRVLDRDTVTIGLSDLPNGTVFSLKLDGAVAPRPDGTFGFATTGLVMPFSLEQGQVQATLQGTDLNELVVRKGDTEARMSGASQDGRYETEQKITIAAGTYDEIGLSGTAAPGATTVRTTLSLTGVKRGPADGTISFTVRGVTSGTMTISVYANTEKVFDRELALGPAPTPTPTQQAGFGAGAFVFAAGLGSAIAVARGRRR